MNLCLIGGGFISQYYEMAFKELNNIKLVALSDLNENCIANKIYNVAFYQDYKKMLEEQKPDIVEICTGVKSHYEIIKYCLENKFDVLVEKPLCSGLSEMNELYSIAHENNKHLECIYHFSFGDEALWLKNNISKLGKIKHYSFYAHEQYAWNENHIIAEEKRNLQNAWEDTSVNLLSDIDMVVNLKNVKKTREILDTDMVSGLNRYAHKTFVNDEGVEFDILVDWMSMDKTKISVIDLDTGRIIIDHHEQIIYFNGQCIYKNIPKTHRMFYQYKNFFKDFKFDSTNEEKTKRLHKIIFM